MNPQPEPVESVLELEVGRIADEFEALCRQGQAPPVEEFVERYPHLADVLREILPAVQILQKSSLRIADTKRSVESDSSPLHGPGSSQQLGRLVDGAYQILGELGRGGMGIVYKARQVALDRVVALKMMRAGVAANPDELARFEREAQTVAQLRHPNIVQIYAVGESAGQPYFSLEYLEGGSLAARLSGQPQPPRQAAELVETLARAVAAAHQLGLVHRDLKPANVLLTADGTPKITDFGLVKNLADDSTQTQGGAIVGTPSYMAPEQASGQSNKIGRAADIYALGAILYDLLTGRPPFKAATTLETLEQVRLHEPASPVKLQPGCPRDLETICLKCLSKDPARRYASAADLADDLRRFLANEPIRARPIGIIERTRKWVSRRPAVAALITVSLAAVLAIVVVGGVSYWQINDALDEKTKSERDVKSALANLKIQEGKTQESLTREMAAGVAKQKALEREELARIDLQSALEREKLLRRQDRQMAYLGKIAMARRALELNDVAQADQYLHECPFDLRHWEWHHLAAARYAEVATFRGHDKSVRCLAYHPDGKRIASRDDSTIRVWDPVTGKEYYSLPCTGTEQNVAFSPNGEWLAASASNDIDKTGWLKVWDAQKGTEIKVWNLTKNPRVRVAFSADSRRLITETNVEIQSLDTTTWKAGPKSILARGNTVRAAFAADGNSFAFERRDKVADGKIRSTVRLYNLQTRQEQIFPAHNYHLRSLVVSPNGKYLAAGDLTGTIYVWDVLSGKEIHCLLGHVMGVSSLAFSSDHRYLVSTSLDQTAKVWHVATGQLAFTIRGHAAGINSAAFAPDGQHLATASADKTMKIWRLSTNAAIDVVGADRADGEISAFALHPQGHLTLATRDGSILIRKHFTGEPSRLEAPKADWQHLANSRDGSRLAAAGVVKSGKAKEPPATIVQTWDQNGQARGAFRGHQEEDRARIGRRFSVCVALGGKEGLAASATRDEFGSAPHTVKIWDQTTGAERFTYRGHEASIFAVAFNPAGDRVASAEWSFKTKRGRIKVWDATNGNDHFTLEGYFGQEAYSLAFSPDGTILAACAGDKVLLWNAQTGVPLRTLTGHSAQVLGIDFSADGQRLLTASQDRTAKLWDVFTGREALSLHLGAEQGFVQARFSPDQQRIAALAADGERRFVKLWHAPLQLEPTVLGSERAQLRHLSISPDGRWLFASWNEWSVWNLETNREEFRLPKTTRPAAYAPESGRCAVIERVPPAPASVKILDLTTRLDVLTLCQTQGAVACLAFSPDGRRLAVPILDHPGERSVVKLFDASTGQELVACTDQTGLIQALAFTDDGRRLIAVSSGKEKGELKIWNTATGDAIEVHTLITPQFSAALSPDRRYAATNGVTFKGELNLWEVASGKHVGTIPLARRPFGFAFSPDGKHLATASEVYKNSRMYGLAQLWEIPTCKEALTLVDPGQTIWGVAFHPQGRWLATGYEHIKIWDLKARQP